jgi:hypothetical protein
VLRAEQGEQVLLEVQRFLGGVREIVLTVVV